MLDPGGAPSGSHDTVTGGAGSDTFIYAKGYGAVTITDFDQGNTGSFDVHEGDQIVLNDLSDPPNPAQVGNNVVADFGNGDVLTFDNLTLAELQSATGGHDGNGNATVVNSTGLVVADADNFVLNGGFEKNDLVGWEVSGNIAGASLDPVPHSGSFSASIDTADGAVNLGQDVGTVPGQTYSLDFWLSNSAPNSFTTDWNNAPIALTAVGSPVNGYTEYHADGLAGLGGPTPLQFTFAQGTGNWALDDVVVAGTPGPAVQTDLGFISFQGHSAADTDAATETFDLGASSLGPLTAPIGTFMLDPVTESNGSGFVQWQFEVNNADLKADLAPGQSVTQAYDVTISDGAGGTTTQVVTVTLDGPSVSSLFTSFTLAIGEGGDHCAGLDALDVTNAQSTDFFSPCSWAWSGGGEFCVTQDGGQIDDLGADRRRVAIAQIEAEEAVQDGSDTAPTFSVWVSDGTKVSPAISPTVSFDIGDAVTGGTISTTSEIRWAIENHRRQHDQRRHAAWAADTDLPLG